MPACHHPRSSVATASAACTIEMGCLVLRTDRKVTSVCAPRTGEYIYNYCQATWVTSTWRDKHGRRRVTLAWKLLSMLKLIVGWLFWTIKHANKWLFTSNCHFVCALAQICPNEPDESNDYSINAAVCLSAHIKCIVGYMTLVIYTQDHAKIQIYSYMCIRCCVGYKEPLDQMCMSIQLIG